MDKITHETLKYLKDGWQKDLHIISAGPSLRGYDFNRFNSQAVMTVNNAILHLPQNMRPKYHVYCEPPESYKDNYIKMSQVPYTKRFTINNYPDWYIVQPFEDIQNYAYQLAIKIGQCMKYTTINLYGYDFSLKDNFVYWWEDEPRKEDLSKKKYILDNQRNLFKDFIVGIKDIKINILNFNHELISIEDYLNE